MFRGPLTPPVEKDRFKSEFILQYLSEPELRRRIRRGLLKVEQLHALARDVFYGRRGRINARELWEQMNTCSCLNLILACIVYWQACEISRVLSECDPLANGIDLSLLEHVSPIEWDNVVLYGQYILDRKLVRQRRRAKRLGLAYKITRICPVPLSRRRTRSMGLTSSSGERSSPLASGSQ